MSLRCFRAKNGLFDRITGKTKDDFMAIRDINMEIEPNTFVSIIGPSGCGKSTLLGMICWPVRYHPGGNSAQWLSHYRTRTRPGHGVPELRSDALDDGGRKYSFRCRNGASQNVSQGDEPYH